MSKHFLHVKPATSGGIPIVLWDVRLECTAPNECGWIECFEKHEVDGVSAENGPYECPPDCKEEEGVECTAPWLDVDVFEFHGQEHMWGLCETCEWCVPSTKCIYPSYKDDWLASALGIANTYGAGVHEVLGDWDSYNQLCGMYWLKRVDESDE